MRLFHLLNLCVLISLTYTASSQSTTEDPSFQDRSFTPTDGGSTTTDNEQNWDGLLPTITIIEEKCFPVYELVNDGCYRGCVSFNLTTNCHFCNTTCNDDGEPDVTDECMSNLDCTFDEICLAKGINGLLQCLPKLTEGDRCGTEAELQNSLSSGDSVNDQRMFEGVSSSLRRKLGNRNLGVRERLSINSIRQAVIPCQSGLVCGRDDLTSRVCQIENVNGTCVRARASDESVTCDDNGNFEPLQCRQLDSKLYSCQCVDPLNNVQQYNSRQVQDLADAPDCDDLVYERCNYELNGRQFSVRHGETYINLDNCTRCLCQNGQPEFCMELGSCRRIKLEPTDLQGCIDLPGLTMEHGDIRKVDCNKCRCFNGTTKCTRNECHSTRPQDSIRVSNEMETEEMQYPLAERACRACKMEERKVPVCGKDGHTYSSACFAVHCAGLDLNDTMPGRCSNYDMCQQHPCQHGEICIPKSRVTCLSRRGCRPDQARTCIAPDHLHCENRLEANSDNSTDEVAETDVESTLCGTDRKNYRSLCSMLQEMGNLKVSYAGPCNRTECLGGSVCGTDGTTYNSVCELRSQSANVRVDYSGECLMADNETSLNALCEEKQRRRECKAIEAKCKFLIQPLDGCCPVCGGVVSIAMDKEGLDEYVQLNPSISDLDDLIGSAIATGFIPQETLNRCNITSSLLDTGDVQIVLESNQTNEQYCNQAAKELATNIDDPTVNQIAVTPQAFQFAMAAVSYPPVVLAFSGALPSTVFSSVLILLGVFFASFF